MFSKGLLQDFLVEPLTLLRRPFAEALLRGVAELNSSAAEMETTSPTWPKLLKVVRFGIGDLDMDRHG